MLPAAWLISSHSSESAMAITLVPLVNRFRFCPPSWTQKLGLAKLQPAHSVTPSCVGSPAPGTPASSVLQPVGGVLVQTFVPGTPPAPPVPTSTLGPKAKPSKFSFRRTTRPSVLGITDSLAAVLGGAAPMELLTTTE